MIETPEAKLIRLASAAVSQLGLQLVTDPFQTESAGPGLRLAAEYPDRFEKVADIIWYSRRQTAEEAFARFQDALSKSGKVA